jgi:RHS repeat-associated protein
VTWPVPGTGYGNKAFTGREWDPEAGLYYYRARYYDPKVGRFISEDPIGFSADVNFYAYVENDPVNRTDPWGLRAEGGQKPKPPTPTPPTPTPTPTPKTQLPWPQKMFNLCEPDRTFVYWDEVSKSVNPFLDRDKWRSFQDKFSSECEKSKAGRSAVCSRMNFFGAVAGWCCCCEPKKTACGSGSGGGGL